MTDFKFGQRENSIIQVAYTVADIDASMRQYTELLGIGPWCLDSRYVSTYSVYRGKRTQMSLSIAVAFAGEVMIELIAQHDDEPSVYQEISKTSGANGFHHWAIGARDFDATVAAHKARGFAEVFSDISPRGARFVYLESSSDMPGLLEVIEMTADVEGQYAMMWIAASQWDSKSFIVHRLQPKKLEAPG